MTIILGIASEILKFVVSSMRVYDVFDVEVMSTCFIFIGNLATTILARRSRWERI